MHKFKKNKNKAIQVDGITNSPGRAGRRLVGSHQGSLLKEDPEVRLVGDFNRPNGYHPSQPLVTGRLMNEDGADKKLPSMINMTLPGSISNLGDEEDKPKKLKTNWKSLYRKLKLASLVGVAVIIITAGFLLAKGVINLDKVFRGNSSGLQAIVSPSALHEEGDGNINILILGIGGAGHDGPDLTDTILLVSIDPVNNKAYLLSVPRDLWINLPGNGQMKINAVYETGKWKYLGNESSSSQNQEAVEAGFNLDNRTVSSIVGIPIKYDVLVDFQAFQQAVDTVGGITVNVPTELYDPTIAWQNNGNPVIAEAGMQHFNGAQALLYVRSRETTSDYARTQRQRQVVVAIKDKALSIGTVSNPVKLAQLSDEFGNNVVTNLSIADANTLYGIIKKVNNSNIESIGLANPPNNYVTTGSVAGQSVVLPAAGFNNYSAIQYYVRNTLKDGYLLKENANITVLNGTNQPNLGNNVANTLKSYGYNVGLVGNAPTQNYKKTVLVDLTDGSDKYTLHYLELRLKVKSINSLPDSSIQPGSANFVIIVGQDEAVNS